VSTMTRTLVVGPGRVGRTLALAHRRAGEEILLIGRKPGPWQEWAKQHGIAASLRLADGAKPKPRLVILAVPDRAIAEAAADCARELPCDGTLIVHVSGMHDVNVLQAAALEGAFTAAMHPVMQFTDPERDLGMLAHAIVTITASPNAREESLKIAATWGARPVRLKADVDRRRYHLGLALASNHITALLAWAEELLRPAFGDEAWSVVDAMASQAMRAHGPAAALTGPIARGDVATVREHLAGLSEEERHRYAGLLDVVLNLAVKSERMDADSVRELRALAERNR
jgi:predicted short-subunit dehydrogenase-like oxidoreductase (DUF2520 family)